LVHDLKSGSLLQYQTNESPERLTIFDHKYPGTVAFLRFQVNAAFKTTNLGRLVGWEGGKTLAGAIVFFLNFTYYTTIVQLFETSRGQESSGAKPRVVLIADSANGRLLGRPA